MRAETTGVVQTRWQSGLGNLGPFPANYTVQATPAIGVASTASLASRRGRQALDVELHVSFEIDLSVVLPDLRLPASIPVPGAGSVATPGTHVVWPAVTVRLSHRDCVMGAHDATGKSASLLAAIALAFSDVILDVPFAAPFLGVALDGLLALVGVEGTANFLQAVVSSLTTRPAAAVPSLGSIAVPAAAVDDVDADPAGYMNEDGHVLELALA